MKQKGIVNIINSPHYPQSNGLTKGLVNMVKNLFYKVKEEGIALDTALYLCHTSPIAGSLKSPIECLENRYHVSSSGQNSATEIQQRHWQGHQKWGKVEAQVYSRTRCDIHITKWQTVTHSKNQWATPPEEIIHDQYVGWNPVQKNRISPETNL